jgi:hypothetical protein
LRKNKPSSRSIEKRSLYIVSDIGVAFDDDAVGEKNDCHQVLTGKRKNVWLMMQVVAKGRYENYKGSLITRNHACYQKAGMRELEMTRAKVKRELIRDDKGKSKKGQ